MPATRESSHELHMTVVPPVVGPGAVREQDVLGADMLGAMAFLRSLYDGAELIAVQTDVEVTHDGHRYSTLTALVRIQTGIVHDYVAIRGQPGFRRATIYEYLVAWDPDGLSDFKQRDYEPEGFARAGRLDEVFPWGRIHEVHRINGYVIVENERVARIEGLAVERDDETRFTVQMLDGRRIGYHSYGSLDLALLYLMAARARFERMPNAHAAWSAVANTVPTELAFVARALGLDGYR